jgi:uncharacterized membrane protein
MVAAGALSLHYAFRLVRWRRVVPVTVFVSAFTVTYFDSGTRSLTALMLVPPVFVAFARAVRTGRGKRWLVVGPLATAVVLWTAQVQLAMRNQGMTSDALAENPLLIWDNDFFTETAIAVSLVPEKFDYLHESTAVLFISNPIPRSWWPSKPYPRVLQYYGIGRRGYDEYTDLGSSSMPSLLGQFHMNWGLWGVVEAAILYGLAFAFIDRGLRRARDDELLALVFSAAVVWLFLGFRALLPGFHYPVLLLGLAVLGGSRSLARASFRRGSVPAARAA